MKVKKKMKNLYLEQSAIINASAKEVFAFADGHSRLSSHMNKSSWMMGGGKMETKIDQGKGQKVGSHIQMTGKVLGINLSLDEVITRRVPPKSKAWETVGSPKLLVIGSYQLGFEIKPQDGKSIVKVFIDFKYPESNKWLGYLFGEMYAKWCVKQMLTTIKQHFK